MGGRAAREKRENWLLIKERDEFAAPGSGSAVVDENPLSVESGRGRGTMGAQADRVWDSAQGERKVETAERKAAKDEEPKAARKEPKPARASPAIPGARKARMPAKLQPQLATLVTSVPPGEDWLHEIKFDGYRILARLVNDKVTLISRNGLDWTRKFPEIAAALARMKLGNAILDGEIVHLAENGQSSFAGLQHALSTGDTAGLIYYCFDLLYLVDSDLMRAKLIDRKSALRDLLAGSSNGTVRYTDHQDARGREFFQHACSLLLEGIVSKQREAPYTPGRSRPWLKVKCLTRAEFVIIGFSDPAGTRKGFGSLLLGYYYRAANLASAGRSPPASSPPSPAPLPTTPT